MPELSDNQLEQLYHWLVEAHQIVVDPDADQYFAENRIETLIRNCILTLKGDPL